MAEWGRKGATGASRRVAKESTWRVVDSGRLGCLRWQRPRPPTRGECQNIKVVSATLLPPSPPPSFAASLLRRLPASLTLCSAPGGILGRILPVGRMGTFSCGNFRFTSGSLPVPSGFYDREMNTSHLISEDD